MRVAMPFGRGTLDIELPDANVRHVLTMPRTHPLDNPERSVVEALHNPIASPPLVELARGHQDAVVVVCDITRPVPNKLILPPILSQLEEAGIAKEHITILVATGLHGPTESDALVDMLGSSIVEGYRVVNHFAGREAEQREVGKTQRGTLALIDRRYVDASLRVTTGYIEPHLMAGYSGGRKLCGIGCGAEQTIKMLHSPVIIEDPNSIEGCLVGNALHEELTEIAQMARMEFIINVTMNEQREVTGVFAGHFDLAFRAGCDFADRSISRNIEQEVDIVVASCGGYPQDISYYHSGKGLTGARHICKKGGTIILLSECSAGIGKSEYVQLLSEVQSVDGFLGRFVRQGSGLRPCAERIAQWQIHNVTRAMRKCACWLVDGALTAEQRKLLLHPSTSSFEEALCKAFERHGPDAEIAVIPSGPNVLARVLKK